MRESRIREGLKLPQLVGVLDANPFCHEQSPFAALSIEPGKPLSHKPLSPAQSGIRWQTRPGYVDSYIPDAR